MQASLRNSYQHYEYGTLECTAHQINNTNYQHDDQLQLTIQHTATPLQAQNVIQHDANLNPVEQLQTFANNQIEPTTCYSDVQSSSAAPNQDQLIVYNDGQHYQILNTHPNNSRVNAIASRLEFNNNEVENVFQHQINGELGIGPTYQTVYYEPVVEGCIINPDQHQENYQQNTQSHFDTRLVSTNFAQSLDQNRDNGNYFQFQQHSTVEQHEQVSSHLSASPLPIHIEVQNHSLNEAHPQPHQNVSHGYTHFNHHYSQQLDLQKSSSFIDSDSNGVVPHSTRDDSQSSSGSTSSSEESWTSSLTRDEKKAREANIPLTYYEIVNLSIEQFNEQLAKHNLTESQLSLIKDIRRRGKNKVAAQSCRKRKMEQISELQLQVNHLALKKKSLYCERNQLIEEHDSLVQEHDRICAILQATVWKLT